LLCGWFFVLLAVDTEGLMDIEDGGIFGEGVMVDMEEVVLLVVDVPLVVEAVVVGKFFYDLQFLNPGLYLYL